MTDYVCGKVDFFNRRRRNSQTKNAYGKFKLSIIDGRLQTSSTFSIPRARKHRELQCLLDPGSQKSYTLCSQIDFSIFEREIQKNKQENSKKRLDLYCVTDYVCNKKSICVYRRRRISRKIRIREGGALFHIDPTLQPFSFWSVFLNENYHDL